MSTSASCPTCGVSSKRVHSRYERILADTAIAGRSSYVVLQVRRFLCSNTGCDRRTFVEQIDFTYQGLRTNDSAAARDPRDRADVGRASRIEVGVGAGSFRRTIYPVAAGPSVA
ncbi:transposase family protein [Rhodococcus sp. 66b]|uniref:transposase family protein n=1 Tax=Rhodococcus sp. 66b TaxID=1945511 RepID=UPI0023799FC8|nr:transposase family protein [Rhodococcus sp. 66b]